MEPTNSFTDRHGTSLTLDSPILGFLDVKILCKIQKRCYSGRFYIFNKDPWFEILFERNKSMDRT